MPRLGQRVRVRGVEMVIIAIRPFGTIDVADPDSDLALRLSGLDFSRSGR